MNIFKALNIFLQTAFWKKWLHRLYHIKFPVTKPKEPIFLQNDIQKWVFIIVQISFLYLGW